MESAWPLLVFSQKEGLDDLLRRAKEIGAPEIACLAAMPKRTASDVLHGHAEPGPETIARIADAVARAVPRTCPACAEHFYGRRDQTTCGAARCRMRLLRARRRASITDSVEALRTLGGAVPADRTWEERSPAWVEVAAFEGGAQ